MVFLLFENIPGITIKNGTQAVNAAGAHISVILHGMQPPGRETAVMNQVILGYALFFQEPPKLIITDHNEITVGRSWNRLSDKHNT